MIMRTMGPRYYIRGTGALQNIARYVAPLGKKVLITGGKTALAVSEATIRASLGGKGITVAGSEWYGGECTWPNVERLCAVAERLDVECLIGVGGGKALDAAKAAAWRAGVPIVTVPTIAATCAAWTPLSAMYDEQGEYLEFSRRAALPYAVVTDTRIVAEAPARYLISGLGDTLAKWYELRAATRGRDLSAPVQAAVAMGKLCHQIILEYGEAACALVKDRRPGAQLEQVIDAVICLAGSVSGFGGDEARTAAAHAIYSGLTIVEEIHQMYHGEIVGFGILCQLLLEGRPKAEVEEYLKLASRCQLPVTLAQMGVQALTDEQWRRIAAVSLQVEDMHTLPFTVTESRVIEAIIEADRWGRRFLAGSSGKEGAKNAGE